MCWRPSPGRGWALEDATASEFATTFYKALLQKERFIDIWQIQ